MTVLDRFRLTGQSALITGGSSGIGRRVALGYAQAGAKVAIIGRNLENAQKAADDIVGQTGGEVIAVSADVTRPDSVVGMVKVVCDRFGGLDIAVCNAGVAAHASVAEMSPEAFSEVQQTNVNGVFLTAQAAARVMIKQGRGGSIITTASISGHVVNVPQPAAHYCASKAAVIQLTKAMAVELVEHGIRVNSVSPGYIMTEMVEPYTEYHKIWSEKIPMGRLGTPEELMGIYLFLASKASTYMTGSDLVIDGGYTSI
jgi:sorbose reductase